MRTYSIFGEDHDHVPVVTFTIDGLDADLVDTALPEEHGIGVRDGRFCAHYSLMRAVSLRPSNTPRLRGLTWRMLGGWDSTDVDGGGPGGDLDRSQGRVDVDADREEHRPARFRHLA